MIAQSTIDAVMAQIDIVDIIKEFITLKKRGANYVGLSPFANERTPSFTVSPAKGIFKDFSSGEGGHAIKFLMLHENWSYPETIRWLAKRYNVEFIEEITKEQADERLVHEAIYICNDFANKVFQHSLTDDVNAMEYIYKTRQLTPEIVQLFEIGLAVDEPDYLTKKALSKSYHIDSLLASDLTLDRNGRQFDKFRNRIMFPIHTISGKIAGFSGRIFIEADKKMAKYVNTAENAVFKKGSLLYGMHLAKHHIKKGEGCYITEGQFDVVTLHAHGIKNTTASSGTALTRDQLRIIKRFTDRLTFLYDGDAAGFKAAARGIELAVEEDMHVRVVVFPSGEDPDSFITNYGPGAFKEYCAEHKLDMVDFFFRNISKLSAEEKDEAKRLILTIIAKIDPQQTFRIKEYVDKLAKNYHIDAGTIYGFLNSKRQYLPAYVSPVKPVAKPDNHELEFARLLLKYGHLPYSGNNPMYVKLAKGINNDFSFNDPFVHKIIDTYQEFLDKDHIPTLDDFLKLPDPDISSFVTDIAFNQYEISENWAGFEFITGDAHLKDIQNGLANFMMQRYTAQIGSNIEKLKTPSLNSDEINTILVSNKKLQLLQKQEADKLGITLIK
jgi:DNA primase